MKVKRFILTSLLVAFGTVVSAQFIFPDFGKWEKATEKETYNKENLWEYINGAATYYMKYGFERLEIQEYAISPKNYITVEVYQHDSHLSGFGIYAFERPSKTTYNSIGSEGYSEENSLNFYGKNYYIKMAGAKNTTETIKAINDLAALLVTKNQLNGTPLVALQKFPESNKVEHGEKFYPENYLGHQFMKNALEVPYRVNETDLKLFTIECKDNNEATGMIKAYLAYAQMPSKVKPGKIIEIQDIFNDLVILVQHENTVFGVHGTNDKTTAKNLLKQLIK